MAALYPLYLDMTRVRCLIVGGGKVAERKVHGILEAGGSVRLVSPEVTAELRRLSEDGAIEAISSVYQREHLSGVQLAFAATDRPEVNAAVCRDARLLDIWVNSAEAPAEGDFIVPAVIRRGDFCLSISTGGANPMLSARIRAELEERFGPEYEELMELLADLRAYIIVRTAPGKTRRGALEVLLDHEGELRRLLRERQGDLARAHAENVVNVVLQTSSPAGEE